MFVAEQVLVVFYTGALVVMVSSGDASVEQTAVYLSLTVFANAPRFWVVILKARELNVEPVEQTASGARQTARPWACRLWFVSCVATVAWYVVLTLLYDYHQWWVLYGMPGLAAANVLLCLGSEMLTAKPSPAEVPGMALQIYQNRVREGTESTLEFESTCIICLSDLEEGQMIGQLPCGHAFHEPCISRWCGMKGHCPMRCQGRREQPQAA